MGLVLKFASQIMISFTLEPPGELEVKRSYATSATTEEPDCDQFQVVYSRRGTICDERDEIEIK